MLKKIEQGLETKQKSILFLTSQEDYWKNISEILSGLCKKGEKKTVIVHFYYPTSFARDNMHKEQEGENIYVDLISNLLEMKSKDSKKNINLKSPQEIEKLSDILSEKIDQGFNVLIDSATLMLDYNDYNTVKELTSYLKKMADLNKKSKIIALSTKDEKNMKYLKTIFKKVIDLTNTNNIS